jgi:hypothetical protein
MSPEDRKAMAAQLMARAKAQHSIYQALEDRDRPAVTRPTATGAPPQPAPAPNTAQQMQQMGMRMPFVEGGSANKLAGPMAPVINVNGIRNSIEKPLSSLTPEEIDNIARTEARRIKSGEASTQAGRFMQGIFDPYSTTTKKMTEDQLTEAIKQQIAAETKASQEDPTISNQSTKQGTPLITSRETAEKLSDLESQRPGIFTPGTDEELAQKNNDINQGIAALVNPSDVPAPPSLNPGQKAMDQQASSQADIARNASSSTPYDNGGGIGAMFKTGAEPAGPYDNGGGEGASFNVGKSGTSGPYDNGGGIGAAFDKNVSAAQSAPSYNTVRPEKVDVSNAGSLFNTPIKTTEQSAPAKAPEPQSTYQTDLEKIKAERQQQRSDNFNMALMQAGLAMAAGTNPNALVNIGAGGVAGLNAFRENEVADRKNYNEQLQALRQGDQFSRELAQRADLARMTEQGLNTRQGLTLEQQKAEAAQRATESARNYNLSVDKQALDARIADISAQVQQGKLNVEQGNQQIEREKVQNQKDYQEKVLLAEQFKIPDSTKSAAILGGWDPRLGKTPTPQQIISGTNKMDPSSEMATLATLAGDKTGMVDENLKQIAAKRLEQVIQKRTNATTADKGTVDQSVVDQFGK